MADLLEKQLEELRIIYSEIIDGSSFCLPLKCYIKHFSELNNIEISKTKKRFYDSYVLQGIPTEKQRLEEIFRNEEWTPKEEDDVISLKLVISDNEKNLQSIIPQQQGTIKRIIQEKKEELFFLLLKRRTAIGGTVEEFCEKDMVNFITYFALFKDKKCEIPLFSSWEEFDSLDEDIMGKYIEEVDVCLKRFTYDNIKKISCLPFFINIFSYTKDDISNFLKTPISKLTSYQFTLCSFGSRNLNVLSQVEEDPPELIEDNDIEKLSTWFDIQYSILTTKRKNK